jgi:hypothetical protein
MFFTITDNGQSPKVSNPKCLYTIVQNSLESARGTSRKINRNGTSARMPVIHFNTRKSSAVEDVHIAVGLHKQ